MIWIISILLFLAVFASLVSSLGILLAKDSFERLHFLGPITLLGSIAILLAVFTQEGFTIITGKTAVTILVLLSTGPVLTHSIARAAVIRGDAKRLRGEEWEVSE